MTRLHDGSGGDGGSGGEDGSLSPFGGEPGVVYMPDLAWRVEKLRLEEQNQQRFLKALPRFLPYTECRKWVQAFGRWKTREDWREWISMGEKRNSYIPVRFSLRGALLILEKLLNRQSVWPRHCQFSFSLIIHHDYHHQQSEPDEYYGRLGQWISWDHFLLEDTVADDDDDGSNSFR